MPTANPDTASRVTAWRAATGLLVRRVRSGGDQGLRRRRLSRWLVGGVLVGLTCLAGCDGGDGETPTATTVASAPSPTATGAGSGVDEGRPAAGFEVGAVVWAVAIAPETNEPIDRVERFPADTPTLYAVVPVSHIAAGSVLSATWRYNGVPLEGLDREVAFDAAPEAPTWVEFHLTLAEGETWPVGTYEIALSVDGQDVRTATVEVIEGDVPAS